MILSRSPADVSVPQSTVVGILTCLSCHSKFLFIIISLTLKSCHATDPLSRRFERQQGQMEFLHLGCSSLSPSEVSSSGNEQGLAVGNSDPQINPGTCAEDTEEIV